MRSKTITIVTCFLSLTIRAQNLESIGKDKPVTISGGVSLNQILYAASGIPSRRDPYSYFATGNLNFSLYGWSIPFSFSVSNQNTSFQQPFNQYCLHPTYKWITAHAGYTSMSYSPYTVNGHIFLGGAIDIAPGENWKLSTLYGRFLKAVEPDTLNQNAKPPSLKRMGYGFKASYSAGRDFVDLTLFHAEDEINSITYLPDSLNVLPQENLVISLGAGKSFFDAFLIKGEFATSALSVDTRTDKAGHSNPLAKTGILYTPRMSSSFYNAYKTSFDYQHNFFTLGIAYEHIDPLYRTLGAYYFNSDLANLTINGSASVLQGHLNILGTAGRQHDNLDNSKISTMRRAVGSLHVNFVPSQRINISASYSNFQTYTNIRSAFQQINQLTPYDNLDTLRFTQLSQNATLTTGYHFGKKEKLKQNVNLNLVFQDAADKQGDVTQYSGVKFYNLNSAYAIALIPQNFSMSFSLNATINQGQTIKSKTYGPVFSISKLFFEKKLRTSISSSINSTFIDGVHMNRIINGRLLATLSIRKKHNISLSSVIVNRESNVETSTAVNSIFTEFTGTLGYNYSFNR